jgi:hypothetical protein
MRYYSPTDSDRDDQHDDPQHDAPEPTTRFYISRNFLSKVRREDERLNHGPVRAVAPIVQGPRPEIGERRVRLVPGFGLTIGAIGIVGSGGVRHEY